MKHSQQQIEKLVPTSADDTVFAIDAESMASLER